jgi:hypothetical protein
MDSLVLELQRDAMDRTVRVSDLLRKAFVVATKLQQNELRDWAQRELKGYMDGTPCPLYRRVEGELRAHNPFRGMIPVVVDDADLAGALTKRHAGQSIAEIEALVDRDFGSLQMPMPAEWLTKIFGRSQEFRLGLIPTLIVDKTALTGILEAVRNLVLDWSLRLEQEGVVGRGLTFSTEEISRATHLTYNIQNFSGVLGNVTSSNLTVGDYNAVRQELVAKAVPPEERAELEAILDSVPKASSEQKKALAVRGMAWLAKNGASLGALSDTIRGWFEAIQNSAGA